MYMKLIIGEIKDFSGKWHSSPSQRYERGLLKSFPEVQNQGKD